jgi:two-component system nitrogen regulation response regulator GlnG
MKLGAYDYVLKPFDVPKLKALVFSALKAAHDMKRVVACGPSLELAEAELGIVGRSEPMQAVFKLIGQLAGSEATALITGESGTGKELVARAIYHHSTRSQQRFLAINCAALPETLLESELFGHERGAFTGAVGQRIGKFEQCHGGTLFLDEIGDMSLATQAKVLRVLQEGSFARVGGNETVAVDVRVIAATHQELERAVAERRFREDLFYRLNVVRIALPPLRARLGDVPLLVSYFLRKLCRGGPERSIATEALDALARYAWPGNVRELENALHRATVMAKGSVILLADLPPEVVAGSGVERAPGAPATVSVAPRAAEAGGPEEVAEVVRRLFRWARQGGRGKVIAAIERELVINALKETGGNQVQAARLLGMTRATLRKRLARYGIRSERSFE